MNKAHFDEFFNYMISQVKKTRDSGQKEYAQENNVFADFDSTAKLSGIKSEIVIYTFLNKHIRGIGSYLRTGEDQRDSLDGRIKDALVYLFLLWAKIEEVESKALDEGN